MFRGCVDCLEIFSASIKLGYERAKPESSGFFLSMNLSCLFLSFLRLKVHEKVRALVWLLVIWVRSFCCVSLKFCETDRNDPESLNHLLPHCPCFIFVWFRLYLYLEAIVSGDNPYHVVLYCVSILLSCKYLLLWHFFGGKKLEDERSMTEEACILCERVGSWASLFALIASEFTINS